MSVTKCDYCGKSVYHAEEQRYNNKVFHIQCMGAYKNKTQAEDLRGRNVMYETPADVQPAYYRVADSGGGAKMESGADYKAAHSGSPARAPSTPKQDSARAPSTPKPETPKSTPARDPSTPKQETPKSPNPNTPQGLSKAQSINISNTNLAFFGSDQEKQIKYHAAQGEPAWTNAGKVPGIQIWRVEKFQIKEWPRDKYGYFFDGDSYIVLNSYGHVMSLKYNVHFWLGKYTTQDEAGTAAYKTVELDDFLGGLPVQYREVQGNESQTFLSLFDQIVIQNGGIDTGFHHVEPEKYRPRLLHIKGTTKQTVVREVAMETKSLNSGDVFLLDDGLKLYQFIGKEASAAEKAKCGKIVKGIDDERKSKCQIFTLEEANEGKGDKNAWAYFWKSVGGKAAIAPGDKESDNKVKEIKEIYRISDASGKLQFTQVPFAKSSLEEDDAFVVSTGAMVFVWVGRRATQDEKKSAFNFAQLYLNENPNLLKSTPIVRVLSGAENDEFYSYF